MKDRASMRLSAPPGTIALRAASTLSAIERCHCGEAVRYGIVALNEGSGTVPMRIATGSSRRLLAVFVGGLAACGATPILAQTLTISPQEITDYKSIYGEVRSRKVAPARARIGGTIASLEVRAGDEVAAGQTLATIGDPKIGLQIEAIEARIAALEASAENAKAERDRRVELFERRVIAQAALDQAQTAFDVASRELQSARSERSVLVEQAGEGVVLAPKDGRVLRVPAAAGAVIQPGETIAEIAEKDYILRLSVPERHARSIALDESVLVAPAETAQPVEGRIVLVYPDVSAGRVVADAEAPGLGDFFVGERVQAWLAVGRRAAITVPFGVVTTKSGVDFVTLVENGAERDIVVRLGPPLTDDPSRVEILSGLRAGDVVAAP